MSCLICVAYFLVVWYDMSHAIVELNRASHCIASNIKYFEVSVVSIVVSQRQSII